MVRPRRLRGDGADLADGHESLVTALWPVSRLLVIGDGLLAAALERVARLLEWEPEIVSGVDARGDGGARA